MARKVERSERFNTENSGYLQPENFGFQQLEAQTWRKELAGQPTDFTVVDWKNIPALEEVTTLQGDVWGMGPRDLVPSNLLAIAGDTGGDIITARNAKGDLEGFVFTMGTIENRLILHMIGVNPSLRYSKDLGWNLSVMQGALAKARGVSEIDWTYDPLRGSNARLNLEKLGATAFKYTVNKYGRVHSDLYGESPTDRFTVRWDLDSQRTRERLQGIQSGKYKPLTLNDVSHLPVLQTAQMGRTPATFLVEVPYDIDTLDEKSSAQWRMQLRNVLSNSITSETTDSLIKRDARITGFATGLDGLSKRSFYVVEAKPSLR